MENSRISMFAASVIITLSCYDYSTLLLVIVNLFLHYFLNSNLYIKTLHMYVVSGIPWWLLKRVREKDCSLLLQ